MKVRYDFAVMSSPKKRSHGALWVEWGMGCPTIAALLLG